MENFNTINNCGITYEEASEIAENAEISRNFSPMIRGLSVGLSTGTSGNRGIFLVSETERANWVAYMIDRVIGFSFRKVEIAFFLRANNTLYESAKSKRIGFNFFDIYDNIDSHIERLNNLNPNILIAQPSVLMILAKKKLNGALRINPKKIISVAEVLTHEDKTYFEEIFKIKLSEVYQCTEGFLASSCSEGFLHFNEDFLIIEKKYIDKERTRFHPIITDLLRKSQPVVRYELNDIITEKKNCKCGSKFLSIESIDGRSDDMIVLEDNQNKKVSIFPDIIRRTIVLSDERIEDYAFIQKDDRTIHLYVKSDFEESYLIAKTDLIKRLKDYNITDFNIINMDNYQHNVGDKKRRVKNEYTQKN
jgi:putative adenylate-forming enzyme